MELFFSTLSQMAFLFSLIVIGYILAKLKVIPENSASVLSKLENTLFLPALVLGMFIENFTTKVLTTAWKPLLFSTALAVIMAVISVYVSKLCTKDGYIRKIYTYGLAFSNFGFMGNAVVEALFPDIYFDYLLFTLPLWTLIYLWGVPALLIPAEGGKRGLSSRLKSFANPMFVCMIIGMLIGISGITLPGWTISVIKTSGSCMSPVAMLLTGITVAFIDIKKILTNVGIYAVSLIRLLVYPLVFAFIAKLLPLDETTFVCALCTLAMPLGLSTIVIPSAYGKDTSVAAGMAIISHALSCITIPIVFMLVI